jgi:hypothetical protein
MDFHFLISCRFPESTAMPPYRSLFELSTAEAYTLVVERFELALPPLDAVENEDWGRDMVLQALYARSDEELASAGISRKEVESDPLQ